MNIPSQPPLPVMGFPPTGTDVLRGERRVCVTAVPSRQSDLLFEVYAAVVALPGHGSTSIRMLQPGQIFRALAKPAIPSGRRDAAGIYA